MGRYDERIKVYHEGTWKPVKQIRVFQGGRWLDLGTNDSDNTRDLYVQHDGQSKRVTLDKYEKPITIVNKLGYHTGKATITTLQQYCFYNTGGAVNRTFKIKMKVKASGACTLVEFTTGWGFGFKLGVKSDGTVYHEIKDKVYVKSTYKDQKASNKIAMGFDKDWQEIELYGQAGQKKFKMIVNGVTTEFNWRTAWDAASYGGSSGTFGADNLRIATDGSFVINTADSPHTALTEQTETIKDVEINWV